MASSLLPPAERPFSLPTCVVIGSSSCSCSLPVPLSLPSHLGPKSNPLDHSLGLSLLPQGCGSALRQSSGAPVLSQCICVRTGALWEIAALLFSLREPERLCLCLRLQCLYCADLGSGIPAWLTYLMGSDICLGVCSLKALCRGDGITGLSPGLGDDSTCFAHQLPKPVCCTVMLPRPGRWGWSSNPMELAIVAPWQLCQRPQTRQ